MVEFFFFFFRFLSCLFACAPIISACLFCISSPFFQVCWCIDAIDCSDFHVLLFKLHVHVTQLFWHFYFFFRFSRWCFGISKRCKLESHFYFPFFRNFQFSICHDDLCVSWIRQSRKRDKNKRENKTRLLNKLWTSHNFFDSSDKTDKHFA